MNLEALTTIYLEEFEAHHGARTVKIWRFWMEAFRDFCREYPCAEPLGIGQLEGFRQRLEAAPNYWGRPYSPRTIYQASRALQGFVRWAAERGHLAADPTRGQPLMGPPPRRVMPRLSQPELLALLRAAPPSGPLGLRDRALLETFVGTTLPLTQAHQLELRHLDLPGAVLHFLDGRSAQLGRRLVDLLGRYLAEARPCLVYQPGEHRLFVGQKGGRFVTAHMAMVIQRYADQAGLGQPISASTLSRSGTALGPDFHQQPFFS